jgi:hypothetical protein
MLSIKSIVITVLKDGKERTFEVEPISSCGIIENTIYALQDIMPNSIVLPIYYTDVQNNTHTLDTNNVIFTDACNQLTINLIREDKVITMNNNTNNTNTNEVATTATTTPVTDTLLNAIPATTTTTEVKMTAEEWAKACVQEATQFVNDNGTPAIKDALSNADESNILDRLQRAVSVTSQSCGKAATTILEHLSAAYAYAKCKGSVLLDTLKVWAMYIWRKVSAAVVGLGYFTMHTGSIVLGHTIAMGKEIYNAFNEDVVQRVKNA